MKKLIVSLIILCSGCGMTLTPSAEKAYRDETVKMRLIVEHQTLQLEITKINAEIARLKAEADANLPKFQLAPTEEPK